MRFALVLAVMASTALAGARKDALAGAGAAHVVATTAYELDLPGEPKGQDACLDFVPTLDQPDIDAPRTKETASAARTLHLSPPSRASRSSAAAGTDGRG